MPIENINDLFEVTKTVHFELKPSLSTKKRIPKAADGKKYLSDARLFLQKSGEAIGMIDGVLKRLQAGEIEGIEVSKDFLKHLDHVRFEKIKPESSGSMWLDFTLKDRIFKEGWTEPKDGLMFQDSFDEKIETLRKNFGIVSNRDLAVTRSELINQTKSDEIRAMKRVALAIKKADLFLTGGEKMAKLHPVRVGPNQTVEFLTQWQAYRMESNDFFEACSAAYRSTKANGEIEWKKCSMNSRGLYKKDVVGVLKSKMEAEWKQFEKFSAEKQEWAVKISKWNEEHSREKTTEEDRLKKFVKSRTDLNDELENWREGFSDYVTGTKPDKNGIERPVTLKKEKISASVKAGKAKQNFQALEEEYFRQQTLDFFSVLLRKDGKYFLAMTKKDDKENLEKLPSGTTAEFLAYRSLTFKALAKYAEKQWDYSQKKLAEKCRFSE
jgi:hypothetical protein